MDDKLIAVDFETYYDKAGEYSLSCMPVHLYLGDPRFDAYLMSAYGGDGTRYCGDPRGFDWNLLSGKTVCAHNASFDEQVYLRLVELGRIPAPGSLPGGGPAEWVCTADLSAYLGVQRNLKTAARVLAGMSLDKSVRERMSGRAASELSGDAETIEYAMGDAVACYSIAARWLGAWPAEEREVSRLNREAGYRGMALDYPLVLQGALKLEARLQNELDLIPWVKEGLPPLSRKAAKLEAARAGIPLPLSLAKDSQDFVEWAEEFGDRFPWVRAMGQYRSINTLLSRVRSLKDGYVRQSGRYPYSIKYFGAATGRFSGGSSDDSGGKFNMQNMPRAEMHGVDVRPMFKAPPGKVLVVADYSQIEARLLLWRVGDEPKLALIRKGLSVYQAYGEALGLCGSGSDIKRDDPHLYKYCKAACLGAGYQCGGERFKGVAKVMAGLDLTDEEAVKAVQDYRSRNPLVVKLWYAHHDALAYSARRRDDTHEVELRSGRVLAYWEPRLACGEIEVTQTRGCNRTRMYGGKLTENEIQATARDLLVHAWVKCAEAGYLPVLNVHDELVFEVPEKDADRAVADITGIMTEPPGWAAGLPLGIDIGVHGFYTK